MKGLEGSEYAESWGNTRNIRGKKLIRQEQVLVSNEEFLFECKFMVHGLCVACMQKASELKSRQEQYEASVTAESKKDKLRNNTNEYSYVVPLQIDLSKKFVTPQSSYSTCYNLVRHE